MNEEEVVGGGSPLPRVDGRSLPCHDGASPLRPADGGSLLRPGLVASDLDGTLLPPDGVFPPQLIAGVTALRQAGVCFVVSTGRMFQSARRVVADLGLHEGPIVCYQGALVTDLADGKPLHHRPLESPAAAAVVRFAHDGGHHINAFVDDRLFVDSEDEWAKRYAAFGGVAYTVVPDLVPFVLEHPPTKLLILAEPEVVERLLPEMQRRWAGELYVTRSLRHHVEINHKDASKSGALEALRRRLCVAPSRTVGCGDSYNDLDMLRWAALGVAVAEAPDEIRRAADVVVPREQLGALFLELAAAELPGQAAADAPEPDADGR
jgi:hypothetical protein